MSRTLARAALALALTTGCASIVNGTRQEIPINSRPHGAEFEVYDGEGTHIMYGTTPSSIVLEKGKGYFEGRRYRVEVSHEGRTQTVLLEPTTSHWYLWGNLIGLVGYVLVDPHNGSMFVYEQESIDVRF